MTSWFRTNYMKICLPHTFFIAANYLTIAARKIRKYFYEFVFMPKQGHIS